jgi:hypothetical protein
MQLLCPRVLTASFLLLVGSSIVSSGQLAPGIALGLAACLHEVATVQP